MEFFIRLGKDEYLAEKRIQVGMDAEALYHIIDRHLAPLAEDFIIAREDGAWGLSQEYVKLPIAERNRVIESIWTKALEIIISSPVDTISVQTPFGKMKAQIGGDPDYPSIFTYAEREDGDQIELVGVEAKEEAGIVRAYLYGDTTRDDYTNVNDWLFGDITDV